MRRSQYLSRGSMLIKAAPVQMVQMGTDQQRQRERVCADVSDVCPGLPADLVYFTCKQFP